MLGFIGRQLKRLVILLPALTVVYVAIYDIYPVFERRVPDVPAFLITYMFMAYVLLPALLRIVRIVFKPKHIPLYCTTPDGFACDPINVGIVGTHGQLVSIMKQAGWYQADQRSLKTLYKMAIGIILRRKYP